MGVVGVLGGQKRAVAQAGVEVLFRRHVIAADARRPAEAPELGGVGPGKVGAGGVDLVKVGAQAETVILAEPLKIAGALDGGGVAAGVMVAHVDAGLVDVGGPHKRRGVPLEHQHPLAPPAALQRRVQAVQPGADDDLVVLHSYPS